MSFSIEKLCHLDTPCLIERRFFYGKGLSFRDNFLWESLSFRDTFTGKKVYNLETLVQCVLI